MASTKKPEFGIKRRSAPKVDQAALARMDLANAQAGGEAKPPASSLMRRSERGEKLTAYLPPELATRLRVACAHPPRRSLSTAVSEAVELWLAGIENG